jgi:exodeoxyribonuclease III
MSRGLSVASWNINSVRLRLPLVIDFLEEHRPDVLCLQEIKCQDDQFPSTALADAGYPHQAVNGQKAYHGVATISRQPLGEVDRREFCDMGDARHISVSVEGPDGPARVHNFYVPSGGDEPDPDKNIKFRHKLDFLAEMQAWFDEPLFDASQIIVGDFNIAPHENDVWNHKQLLKVVSHTPREIEILDRLRDRRAWVDVVRRHVPVSEPLFSWWSYRARDWDKADKGRRLDHIWATKDLGAASTRARVIRAMRGRGEKPSDHAPVMAEFS